MQAVQTAMIQLNCALAAQRVKVIAV